MDLNNLIDELEKTIERGRHLPAGRVLLDETRLQQILADIRLALPDEGRLGQRVSGERDRILGEARAQGRRIIEEAQAQVNMRLEEQHAVQLARERARQITTEAEQNAARVRADANTYVASQLAALENRLQRALHEVQSGQRYLTQPADKSPDTGR